MLIALHRFDMSKYYKSLYFEYGMYLIRNVDMRLLTMLLFSIFLFQRGTAAISRQYSSKTLLKLFYIYKRSKRQCNVQFKLYVGDLLLL